LSNSNSHDGQSLRHCGWKAWRVKPEREPTKNFWDEKFVNRDDYLEATRELHRVGEHDL